MNPAGFASRTYPARFLSTGEVVPTSLPMLSAQMSGMNIVLSWSGNFSLQSATNVAGPYFDVSSDTNPCSVNVNQFQMQFFRLRD